MYQIYKFNLKMREFLENWRYWAHRVTEASKSVLGPCEVYVFGSIAECEWTNGSDLDILVICDQLSRSSKDRAELKALIEEKAGLPLYSPVEIHLVTREEAKWYWRHIKKSTRIY